MANKRADADATGDWYVRFSRRRDGRKYYFRYDCALTSREESAKRMPEEDAKGLAAAITKQHPDFTAKALKYRKPKVQRPRVKVKPTPRDQGETVASTDEVKVAIGPQNERNQQDAKK